MLNLLTSIPLGPGTEAADGVGAPVAGVYAALILRPAAVSVGHGRGPEGILAYRIGFARDPPTRWVGAAPLGE